MAKKLNGTVIVTYRCNARCNMCNRYKVPSRPEEEITLETIRKLPEMYFTNITGGEPFIREDLKDIVRELQKKSDRIVISTNGGYPMDQNIYQSVKGMTAAEATVKENGVIIMLSKAADGHGGKSFHETFRDEKDLNRMMQAFLDRRPEETIIDQWQSQIFVRVLLRATVIFISDAPDDMVRDMHMIPAHSLEEAVEQADAILAQRGIRDAKILAIPDGVSVIVRA